MFKEGCENQIPESDKCLKKSSKLNLLILSFNFCIYRRKTLPITEGYSANRTLVNAH